MPKFFLFGNNFTLQLFNCYCSYGLNSDTPSSYFPHSVPLFPKCQSLLVIMNLRQCYENLESNHILKRNAYYNFSLLSLRILQWTSWIVLSLCRDCKDPFKCSSEIAVKQNISNKKLCAIYTLQEILLYLIQLPFPLLQVMKNKKIASSMQNYQVFLVH